MPNTPVGDGPNFERALTTHFEAARRRASVSRFYTDVGPREEWDAPLSKFVKVSGLRNRRRDQKAAMSKLDSFTPVQSLIAENDYKERLSQVSHRYRVSQEQLFFFSNTYCSHKNDPISAMN